jgi:hypothetical protein
MPILPGRNLLIFGTGGAREGAKRATRARDNRASVERRGAPLTVRAGEAREKITSEGIGWGECGLRSVWSVSCYT